MRAYINGEGTFLSPANIKDGGWKTSAPVIDRSAIAPANAEAEARETDKALGKILKQKDLTLAFWRSGMDRMLSSNDQPLLAGPGAVSHEAMKSIAGERYDDFDARRRQQEALNADAEDLKAIEELEKDLKRKGGRK